MWIASISTYTLHLGVKRRGPESSQIVTFLTQKPGCGAMVVQDYFLSQPRLTIHHTHDDIFEGEGSSWCELLESVQTHSILVWSAGAQKTQPNFHLPDSKIRVWCDGFEGLLPVSTSSNHSSSSWWYIWRWRVKLMWIASISTITLHLGVKRRGPEPSQIVTFLTQKPGCGDGFAGLILISTLPNHSSY